MAISHILGCLQIRPNNLYGRICWTLLVLKIASDSGLFLRAQRICPLSSVVNDGVKLKVAAVTEEGQGIKK